MAAYKKGDVPEALIELLLSELQQAFVERKAD